MKKFYVFIKSQNMTRHFGCIAAKRRKSYSWTSRWMSVMQYLSKKEIKLIIRKAQTFTKTMLLCCYRLHQYWHINNKPLVVFEQQAKRCQKETYWKVFSPMAPAYITTCGVRKWNTNALICRRIYGPLKLWWERKDCQSNLIPNAIRF